MKTDDPPGAGPPSIQSQAAALTGPEPGDGNQFLLKLEDVRTYFRRPGGLSRRAGTVRAVDGVSLSVRPGETVGLVGESGCGKTTLGRTIMRLEKPTSGRILFDAEDLTRLSAGGLKRVRSNFQMIFQDPRGSLDPQMRVAEIISEGIGARSRGERADRAERVADIVRRVGLSADHLRRYPHEFSGGQLQRIGIARALIRQPRLIVADEAVSALDVSVQSQILNLMVDLQAELGIAYVFISHDLSVVEYMSDRVGVMYLGKIVELGSAAAIYAKPLMPYTQALLSATPEVDRGGRERIVLSGDVPSPLTPPSGCAFRTRCWMARDICATTAPPLEEVEPGHWSACHFSGEARQRTETQ
jgi:peptide/nickel transport system ATP-binding protein/oligopeptide transport system ATP-binding protein